MTEHNPGENEAQRTGTSQRPGHAQWSVRSAGSEPSLQQKGREKNFAAGTGALWQPVMGRKGSQQFQKGNRGQGNSAGPIFKLSQATMGAAPPLLMSNSFHLLEGFNGMSEQTEIPIASAITPEPVHIHVDPRI